MPPDPPRKSSLRAPSVVTSTYIQSEAAYKKCHRKPELLVCITVNLPDQMRCAHIGEKKSSTKVVHASAAHFKNLKDRPLQKFN